MSFESELKKIYSFDEGNAGNELQTSRHILKALYESTQSSIYVISADYKIIFFNKKAADGSRLLFGTELVIGESILETLRPHSDDAYTAFKRNLELALAGTATVSERELQYPGFSTWIRAEYSPVYEDQKIVAVCFRIKEINDRKQFEGQIEKQNDRLKEIAWIQSHETRQPVATILGLINILDKKTLTEDNREIVALLEKTIVKLDEVIRDTIVKANSLQR
ncbi:MAG TPA: PAS domain S-box protein [Cyclobacteriaceae bacterium]|jgi:PAS domain S-box-containing protein|nr:PAS domain S-box protein [Cyclobacteriaceae bacterium]